MTIPRPAPPHRLVCLNLNGLRSAATKGLHPWLQALDPEVVCLQELRIQRDQLTPTLLPPGDWSIVQADAEKKGYAGTAVWSKEKPNNSSTNWGLPRSDSEGRFTRVDLSWATVVSAYLPSGSSGEERQAIKDQYLKEVDPRLDALLAEGRPTIFCGDLNIAHTEADIHNPKSNKDSSGFLPHERAWMSALLARGWVDLYRHLHPGEKTWSWWSNRGQARALDRGWRIDYILCSPDLAARARKCEMVGREPHLSDHCAILAEFDRR